MAQESGSKKKASVLKRLKHGLIRYRIKVLTAGFIFLFLVVFFAPSMFVTIGPGHVGVLFRRLWGGTVADRIYREGLHIILPFNQMYSYDARILIERQVVDILSSNGLTIQVHVSVRYHIVRDQAALLHKQVGADYREKIIIPSTISSVREVVGKYRPEELYTTARHLMQDDILVEQIEQTGRIPIIYDDLIVENIKLPGLINDAIEAKLKLQQEYLAYEFKLAREREEANRRKIEAEGIRAYNDIIEQSLSEQLLTWLGIKATVELSKSPNSKIVVIGSGKEGLPIILNTGEAANPKLEETPSQGDAKEPERSIVGPPPPSRGK